MPLTDKHGKTWAHSTTVKVGDILVTDDGFTCMGAGERKTVESWDGPMPNTDPEYLKDPFSRLFVECRDGCHFLDGQVGDDGELVGLYPG